MSDLQIAEQIAGHLLRIGAIVLRPEEPFIWTSGLRAPIYCDNRVTISYPEVRDVIADAFAARIRALYPEADVIAGAATGGIPHAAWVADKLGLPMIYVRDKPKGHGKQNMIEGVLRPGQKVVVIEDLISTGGSSLKVAQAINEAAGLTLAVIAIFNYQLRKSQQAFADADITLHTLSHYEAMLVAAAHSGAISPEQVELLKSWRLNPEQYGV